MTILFTIMMQKIENQKCTADNLGRDDRKRGELREAV